MFVYIHMYIYIYIYWLNGRNQIDLNHKKNDFSTLIYKFWKGLLVGNAEGDLMLVHSRQGGVGGGGDATTGIWCLQDSQYVNCCVYLILRIH